MVGFIAVLTFMCLRHHGRCARLQMQGTPSPYPIPLTWMPRPFDQVLLQERLPTYDAENRPPSYATTASTGRRPSSTEQIQPPEPVYLALSAALAMRDGDDATAEGVGLGRAPPNAHRRVCGIVNGVLPDGRDVHTGLRHLDVAMRGGHGRPSTSSYD